MTLPHAIACLTSAVIAFSAVVAGDEKLPYRITTKRGDDRVEVKAEKGKVRFSIHSPFGISHAVIERVGETWPDAVILRLYLKGLENFRATNEKVKLGVSMSSQDGKVRLWKDDKEDSPLDSKSPYWMEVRMVGKDGKPTKVIPLKDGYIEMQLPYAFFEGNPKSITVSWIDFYRN